MLRQMRSSFKHLSWTLWLVIIAFIGGFVMLDAFRGEERAKTGLIFLDEELAVREGDYYTRLINTLERYKKQLKDLNKDMITRMKIPENLLQSMVDAIIIQKEAARLNLNASEREIKDKIMNNPSFQRDGRFIGLPNYRRLLARNNMKVTDFENQVRDDLIREKLTELVTAPLVIDDGTLREKYKKEKDSAELEYIMLRPERIKTGIDVRENEITGYYEKNKEDFKSPEKRSAYVIAFKFDDYKKKVSPTENDIYDRFTKNISDFAVPGKTKISRIFVKYNKDNRDEILKKTEALQKELTRENFAEKAKEFSQDAKANMGGDHGYTDWKNFTAQERSMIEDHLGEHEISTPIDTQGGFSIIYVSELVPRKEPVYHEAKEKIKNILENEKVNQYVMKELQGIYNKLGKAENIKAKAAEIGIDVIETGLLTKGQAVKDVDDMGYISRTIFDLKEKESAFPVQFVKGIAIVQVAKIDTPQVLPLEEVKDRVKDKMQIAKKFDTVKQQAEQFTADLNRITDTKNIEEYLKDNDLKIQSLNYRPGNRFSYLPARKGMDDLVFSMEEGRFSSPIEFEEQSRVIFFKVKKKTVTGDSEFQKDKSDFYKQKATELRNNYFYSYLANKKESIQIVMNRERFQELKDKALLRFK